KGKYTRTHLDLSLCLCVFVVDNDTYRTLPSCSGKPDLPSSLFSFRIAPSCQHASSYFSPSSRLFRPIESVFASYRLRMKRRLRNYARVSSPAILSRRLRWKTPRIRPRRVEDLRECLLQPIFARN